MVRTKREQFETKFADNFQPSWFERFIQQHEVYRADVMFDLLPKDGKVIVDLACGDGDFLLKAKNRFTKLIGFDIADARLKNARKKLSHLKSASRVVLKRHDLDQGIPLAKESVDVVVCEASLSYFVRPDLLIEEVRRILKPGGSFIVQVGNYAFLPRRLALLLGRLPKISSFAGFGDGGMIQYFTYGSLKSVLVEKGFVIEEQRNSGVFAKLRGIWPTLLAGDMIYRATKSKNFKKESADSSRVLIIHNQVSPHVTPTFQALSKKIPLTVWYCAEREANREWDEKPTGFPYQVLPSWKLALVGKDVVTLFLTPSIFQKLREFKPSLVIISGWDLPTYHLTCLYCRVMKVPYLIWSGSTRYEVSWRRAVSAPLVRWLIAGAAGFIAYGSRAKEYLIDLGAPPNQITVAYNTTNMNAYLPNSKSKQSTDLLKKKLGFANKQVILFYGQLIQRKGVDTLLTAYQQIKLEFPQLALLIIGNGSEESALKEMTQTQRLSDVLFLANPGDVNMPSYFHLASIFVLPSREEVWGLVVNQAMTAGVPIIVSDKVGAGADLIQEGVTGFTFADENSQQLTNLLRKILKQPQRARRLSKSASKLIQNITPEKTASQIQKAINQVRQKTND